MELIKEKEDDFLKINENGKVLIYFNYNFTFV